MTLPMMHSSTLAGSMPARATASRTAIAPSSVAVKSFRAPRNLPVGVRTAETITLWRIQQGSGLRAQGSRFRVAGRPGHDSRHLIASEDVLHLHHHARLGAINFLDPPPIDGAHREHPVAQLHRRRASERLAHGQLPREVGSLFRRRLPPDDFREDTGGEALYWNHVLLLAHLRQGYGGPAKAPRRRKP